MAPSPRRASRSTAAKATPASPTKGRKRAVILIPETPPRNTRNLPGLSVRKFLELEAKNPYMTEAEYEETVTSLKKTPIKSSSPSKRSRAVRTPSPEASDDEDTRPSSPSLPSPSQSPRKAARTSTMPSTPRRGKPIDDIMDVFQDKSPRERQAFINQLGSMGIVSPTKSKPTVREDSPPWNRHIASSDQEEVECETDEGDDVLSEGTLIVQSVLKKGEKHRMSMTASAHKKTHASQEDAHLTCEVMPSLIKDIEPRIKNTYIGLPPLTMVFWNKTSPKVYMPLSSLYDDYNVDDDLLNNIVTARGDTPDMVNPARADPRMFEARAQRGSSFGASYVYSGATPVIFFAVGAISSVYLEPEGRQLGQRENYIRGINLAALAVDWPRTACFFGNVFRKSEVQIGYYQGDGQYQTRSSGALGKSKGKRIEDPETSQKSTPVSSLSLAFESDVPTYDGRQATLLFSANGKPHARLRKLPPYTETPPVDGVAMVTYTANHYRDASGGDRISFNLLSIIMLSDS